MNRMSVAWLTASAIVLLFALLGTWLPGWIGLSAASTWILRVSLWLLGAAAGLLLFLHLRARAKSLPAAAPDDEVDGAFDAARRRLPSGVKIGKAPVLLVLGPQGAAKTTVIQKSGLDAELLAGEVQRDGNVVPSTVNIWYASGTLVAEAGGRLLEDERRWGRLLERLEPSRMAAVLARGRQAPRLAIVCVSCEELARPGAAQALVASAHTLRQRLFDAANRFGVRLPVYVVFTKADRIPYFTDFVRSFTRDEAAELLGATLPIAPPVDAGQYKEAQNARLESAFSRMLHGLSLRRLDVLPRETAEEVRAGVYEFPRELGKLSSQARQFLVELTRPGQIGISPFLRGFYFTGVRPLVVTDTPQAIAPDPVPGGGAVDATAVFDPRAMLAAAQQAAQRPQAGQRRVPDWTFLPRLFRQVILADRVAMGITGGGSRVNLFRRVGLAIIALALLLLSAAFVTSWLNNRRLIADAHRAAVVAQGVDLSGVGLPTPEHLARLDTLRQINARLRAWDTAGVPLRYRWGLYAGDELLPELRRNYFLRFRPMLWQGTRDNMAAYLQALPDTPTAAAQYDTAYAALKAYIITSDHPQYSTPDFLRPVLMHYWHGPRDIDPERGELAAAQFDFFADELRFGNPYDAAPDAAIVRDTRDFLGLFAGADRLYQSLIGEASTTVDGIRFHEVVPGADRVMRNDFTVPGAFTRDGWQFVEANVENVQQFFENDQWVLGEQTVPQADRARLEIELRRRYRADYVSTWAEFLSRTRVLGYGSPAEAGRRLGILGDNQSPLLRLLAIASQHTAVDTVDVGPAFQPVRAVVPADAAAQPVGPTNQQYVAGLAELGRQMEQAAQGSGSERQNALNMAEGTAQRIDATVAEMALAFSPQGAAAGVGNTVRALLEAPIQSIGPLVRGAGAAEINQHGASFCSTAAPVLRKYPFNGSSSDYATLDDLNRVFRPTGSALASLTQNLSAVIELIGSDYRAQPGAQRPPTAAFLSMLNRMKDVSDALYPAGAQAPTIQYSVAPQLTQDLQEVTFSINGQNHNVTSTTFGSRTFQWRIQDEREAQITARRLNGENFTLVTYTGPWATFRLFGQAAWQSLAGAAYRLTWNVNTGTASADLMIPAGVPIFDRAFLASLGACDPRVVQ